MADAAGADGRVTCPVGACAGPSPLSPIMKSLVVDSEPPAIGLRGRLSIMHRIESRFRFLAVRIASTRHTRTRHKFDVLSGRD